MGLFDKLFGGGKKKVSKLSDQVEKYGGDPKKLKKEIDKLERLGGLKII